MEKGAHGAGLKRLGAVAVLVALAFVAGQATCPATAWLPPEPMDYETLTSVELSWVQEGIQERISELEDELALVRELQQEKTAYLHD